MAAQLKQAQDGNGVGGEMFVAVQVEQHVNGSLVAAIVPSTQLHVIEVID